MSLQPNKPNQESGIATILLVLAIMALLSTVIALAVAHQDLDSHASLQHDQLVYLQRAQKSLRHWYVSNAGAFDAGGAGSTSPWNASQILAMSGAQVRWNAKLFVSGEQCLAAAQGNICYHTLWFAVPDVAGPAPSLNGNNFNPGNAQYVSVSGERIESALYNRSMGQLNDMAATLQAAYNSYSQSSAIHNSNIDWFAPSGCTPSGSGPFQCSNGGYIDLSQFLSGSGIASRFNGANAWGLPVLANNSSNPANDVASPFTMILQSPLPWMGETLQATIVQPL